MKYTRRFWISWILTSVVMFTMSYVWHGLFLNDYELIAFPRTLFVTASVVDPFGNVLGIVYNPHYLETLAALKGS